MSLPFCLFSSRPQRPDNLDNPSVCITIQGSPERQSHTPSLLLGTPTAGAEINSHVGNKLLVSSGPPEPVASFVPDTQVSIVDSFSAPDVLFIQDPLHEQNQLTLHSEHTPNPSPSQPPPGLRPERLGPFATSRPKSCVSSSPLCDKSPQP